MRLARLLLLLSLPFLLACPPDDDDDTAGGDDDDGASCAGVATVAGTNVRLEEFAAGLEAPTFLTHAGDGTGRVFVTEHRGEVIEFSSDGSQRTWLDLTDRVDLSTGNLTYDEQGLFAIAFHPDFSTNGRFFVSYTAEREDPQEASLSTVSEFAVTGDPLSGLADPTSERVLLTVGQEAANHNGGQILFGPDGYLYIGFGDGGGAGDSYDNGQRKDTFQAKILRIDVNAGDPYSVPADNPFVGDDEHLPETWSWGMRNPWRISFDRETGDMWVADVGQDQWEEIHIVHPGGNYGWPEMEGNHCYTAGCDPSLFEPAIWEYRHTIGVSITGGYVYRGCKMPDLHGAYFFSDYNYFDSPLWTLTWDGEEVASGPVSFDGLGSAPGVAQAPIVASFGEDEQGEIYICDHAWGYIYKIVPG
jgi:glucose/arabinose dehydrogenase